MENFSFYNPARIIFGEDSLSQLATQLDSLGKTVLFHYGSGSIKRSGLYEEVIQILKDKDINIIELGGVQPNPTYDLVEEGIRLCIANNVDGILAVGGGSVIDSAKGIAAGVLYKGDDFESAYVLNETVHDALPLGCVLTIPAAGSESSPTSVVTVVNKTYKRSIRGVCLIPKFAIINPAWFVTLRSDQAAVGICDIFSHLLERYFTNTQHVDYTDRLLEATMRTVIHYGPHVVNHLDDVAAWSELGFAGTLAHNGLLGSGRQEDWASHRIEHELSALYDIAHGAGLAIIFPAWMKHVSKVNETKFIQFAQRVFDVDYAVGENQRIVDLGIERYEQFLKSMYLPVKLHEAGILEDQSEVMLDNLFYKRPESFGNYVSLKRADVKTILDYAK